MENNTDSADSKYTEELQNLENRTSGEETADNAEPESQLVEQDGEFYLSDDSGEEETIEEPAEGESEIEELETEESTTSLTNEDDIYANKTREEIIQMHQNAQKKMGEQGDELGQLRELALDVDELTDTEIFERLTADDIADGVKAEKQKLDEMDPYDTEARTAQQELIRDMEDDLITKRTQESIASRMNTRDNDQFVQKQKQVFKDQGIDISDEDFNLVSERANDYRENGLLTEKAFHKALVDQYGLDHVVKNLSMKGEQKARADIKKAAAKTTEKVDVKGSGKASKLIKISDLSRREMRKSLDNLSVEDLRKLQKQYMNK
tara:strand:- start:898 stop:1863 length:966 start_codon:yes stop_codon:yes gene_type:complete